MFGAAHPHWNPPGKESVGLMIRPQTAPAPDRMRKLSHAAKRQHDHSWTFFALATSKARLQFLHFMRATSVNSVI